MICNFYYLINWKKKIFICPRLFYGQLCANYENSSAQFRQAEEIRLKQPQLSGSNLIYQILHGQCHIWDLYVLGLKSNFFCKKPTTKYSKPWTRDSQCQDEYCSLAETTQNAPTFFGQICLPKPKSFNEKRLHWAYVVRESQYFIA